MKSITINIILSICTLLTVACSSVRIEIEDNTSLSKLKRVGFVIRHSKHSRITSEEQQNSIFSWMGDHKPLKDLSYVSDCSEDIVFFDSVQERFYQLSENRSFLRFKSIGVVNLYLRKNETELKNIISQSNLDGLIIYEINNIISAEMQFMDFDSVLVIADKNLNVLFLDHQTDGFESSEIEFDVIKGHLMDKISQRFVKMLLDQKYIKK